MHSQVMKSVMTRLWNWTALGILVVVYLNLETFAASQGWDGLLVRRVPFMHEVFSQLWAQLIAACLAGCVIGAYVNHYSDALVRSKRADASALGKEIKAMSDARARVADVAAGGSSEAGRKKLLTEIEPYLIKLRALGIVVPSVPASLSLHRKVLIYHRYFEAIQDMLAHGELEQAKKDAVAFSANAGVQVQEWIRESTKPIGKVP